MTEILLKGMLVKNLAENNANFVTFGIANGVVSKSYSRQDPEKVIADLNRQLKEAKDIIHNLTS